MKKNIIGILIMFSLFFGIPASSAAPLDSDKDSLSDDLEKKFGTDINNPDTDGDGFKDGQEIDWGYDPSSASSTKLSQRIEIDLKKQKLYYFVDGIKWRESKVSTGKSSMPTPKGEFKIQNKIKKAWSKTYGLWMPYWLGIGGSVGIHELPVWPNGYREGENHLGTPVSHGCIRLGLKDASYIYDRVSPGVSVKIY